MWWIPSTAPNSAGFNPSCSDAFEFVTQYLVEMLNELFIALHKASSFDIDKVRASIILISVRKQLFVWFSL